MGKTITETDDLVVVMQALAACVGQHGVEPTGDCDPGTVRVLRLPVTALQNLDPTGTLKVWRDTNRDEIVVEQRAGPRSRRLEESVRVIMGD